MSRRTTCCFWFSGFIFLLASATILANDMTDAERHVWQLEIAWWEALKNNDRHTYANSYDTRFTGWPHRAEKPNDLDGVEHEDIGTWIPQLHANPAEHWNYELRPEKVRQFGDTVVAIYVGHGFFESAETGERIRTERNWRLIHVWSRVDREWKIISGMTGDATEIND